jgi:hypothetical protein
MGRIKFPLLTKTAYCNLSYQPDNKTVHQPYKKMELMPTFYSTLATISLFF